MLFRAIGFLIFGTFFWVCVGFVYATPWLAWSLLIGAIVGAVGLFIWWLPPLPKPVDRTPAFDPDAEARRRLAVGNGDVVA